MFPSVVPRRLEITFQNCVSFAMHSFVVIVVCYVVELDVLELRRFIWLISSALLDGLISSSNFHIHDH
jgi:hypothetical protein